MKSALQWLLASSIMVSATSSVLANTDEGAKGLYFAQLEKPSQNMNTGVQYWIELHRNNKISKINNKTTFHTGDQIRFHVKPNIDGYAYIVLRSGSRGEQAVLFPDAQRQEDNQVKRGQDYILPNDGSLKFDQNPGIEKISLLLSRTPINTEAYLSPPADASSSPLIATIASGSKDLIPCQILVSYKQPSALPEVSSGGKTSGISSSASKIAAKVKASKEEPVAQPVHISKAKRHIVPTKVAHALNNVEPGITTVVYREPSGVLAVDVSLEHQ